MISEWYIPVVSSVFIFSFKKSKWMVDLIENVITLWSINLVVLHDYSSVIRTQHYLVFCAGSVCVLDVAPLMIQNRINKRMHYSMILSEWIKYFQRWIKLLDECFIAYINIDSNLLTALLASFYANVLSLNKLIQCNLWFLSSRVLEYLMIIIWSPHNNDMVLSGGVFVSLFIYFDRVWIFEWIFHLLTFHGRVSSHLYL